MNLPTITSKFTHVAKGAKLNAFKNDYFMAVPKFLVFIDGVDFEYTNGAKFFTDAHANKLSRMGFKSNGIITLDSNMQYGYYYDKVIKSLEDFTPSNNLKMSDEGNLFALLSVLQDAIIATEYCDIDNFLVDFGYDSDIKSMREGERVYRAVKNNFKKLNWSINRINNTIEILAEMGIE